MTAILVMLLAPAPGDGIALYRGKQFVAAEQALRRTLTQKPDDQNARLYLARTLLALGRTPEALAELQQLDSMAGTPEVRFQTGRLLREMAARRFGQLQALAPNSPATLELAGDRLEWTGKLDEALAKYRAAAAADANRPGIHYRIGNALWRKRETEAASEALRRELSLNPGHGLANLRMGSILLNAGREGDAIPFFERALAAIPTSMEALREVGKAYRKTGKTAEARKAWEAVAKARPSDDQVHYLLSGLYRELGESELARQELELHRAVLARRRQSR